MYLLQAAAIHFDKINRDYEASSPSPPRLLIFFAADVAGTFKWTSRITLNVLLAHVQLVSMRRNTGYVQIHVRMIFDCEMKNEIK